MNQVFLMDCMDFLRERPNHAFDLFAAQNQRFEEYTAQGSLFAKTEQWGGLED